MTTHPDYPGLHEGPSDRSPLVRGAETWFCAGKDVPIGCDRRQRPGGTWVTTRSYDTPDPNCFYQVRNVPAPRLPDPQGWPQSDGTIITTREHLVGRDDIDQWEYLTNGGVWSGGTRGFRALKDILADTTFRDSRLRPFRIRRLG